MRKDWVTDELVLRTLDAAPDAVVLFTINGKVVYANEAVATVFGWTADALVGKSLVDVVHPDDLQVAIDSVAVFDDQGARARTPAMMRFLWADGSWATLEVNGNPVTASDGTTLYSMFGRRSEEQRIMAETIRTLARDFDLTEIVALAQQQLSWGLDHARTTFAWTDEAGEAHRIGEDVPDACCGYGELTEGSPWVRAWAGEEVAGETADLPDDLRDLASSRGLRGYRVHPIVDDQDEVRLLITLWDDGTGHPLNIFENRLKFVGDLLQVAFRFAEHQRRLVHDAAHDALTGLANRRSFYSALRIGADASAEPRTTAVLAIDLDGFKPVNDAHGHGAGDLLLVEVAQRLRDACRSSDVVARLGGDEFAVFCPGADAADVTRVAERFLEGLDRPIDVGGQVVTVRASVGAAVGPPHDAEALATDADRALYEAKRAGGHRLVVAPA